MRNLKKILALVLALMMVVSMMVTASATSFVDDADINDKYYEAVSVLSGIGVIRGVENADGTFNFNPKGALNRAQAATIIAYVLRGNLDGIADEVFVYENDLCALAAGRAFQRQDHMAHGAGLAGGNVAAAGEAAGRGQVQAAGIERTGDLLDAANRLLIAAFDELVDPMTTYTVAGP